MQHLDYQPSAKRIPVVTPIPISRSVQKQRSAGPTAPDTDLLKNCLDIQQCFLALAGKYSLNSFTIATSDGLIFASCGGSTALEDAARYGRNLNGLVPEDVTLFSVNHKGSELTGIIRSEGIVTGEIQKRIANDTKNILDRWI